MNVPQDTVDCESSKIYLLVTIPATRQMEKQSAQELPCQVRQLCSKHSHHQKSKNFQAIPLLRLKQRGPPALGLQLRKFKSIQQTQRNGGPQVSNQNQSPSPT